jgi:hypothetical protein
MLRVNNLAAVAAFDQSAKFFLPLDEWRIQQLFELAHTTGIECGDLSVQDALCALSPDRASLKTSKLLYVFRRREARRHFPLSR